MKKYLLASLLLCLTASGCANQSKQVAIWPEQYSSQAQTVIDAWARGELSEIHEDELNLSDPENIMILAESAALRFDAKTAVKQYVRFVKNWPDHPLTPAALIRIHQIMSDSYESLPIDELLDIELSSPYSRAILIKLINYSNTRRVTPKESPIYKPLTQFSWVGPFTPFGISEMDAPIAPDNDDILADTYETTNYTLKKFHYQTKTKTHFSAPSAGLYVGETYLDVMKDMTVIFVSSSRNPYALFVDGKEVTPESTHHIHWNDLSIQRVQFKAGHHTVRVKLSKVISDANEPFSLWITPESSSNEVTVRSLLNNLSESVTPAENAPSKKLDDIAPDYVSLDVDVLSKDALASWAYNVMAIYARDMKSADAMIKARQKNDGNDVQNAIQSAHRMNNDGDYDASNRVDSAIVTLETVTESAPQLVTPILELSSLLLKKHYTQQAFELVQQKRDILPQNADTLYFISKLYNAKEWSDDERDALNEAYHLQPESCALTLKYIESQKLRNVLPARSELSTEMQKCPKVAMFYAENGIGDDKIIAGLESQYPDSFTYRLPRLTKLAKTSPDDAFNELTMILERVRIGASPKPEMTQLLPLIDAFRVSGREDYAKSLSETIIETLPGDADPHLVAWFLNHEKPFMELRKDGIDVIKQYVSTNPASDASSIIVLDYAATKYFETGASITLTHTITRVTDKDGLNTSGEIYIPQNAAVLNMRTIKQNTYAVIEPETIGFKQSVTAPNLGVGDFIEVEYVTFNAPSMQTEPSTVLDLRFYFGMAQTPLVHSEYIIEYPASWTMTPLVHNTPKFTVTPVCESIDNSTRCTASLDNIPPFISEPATVPLDDLLPNIQFYSNYSWDLVQRKMANKLASQTRLTPYIVDYLNAMNVPAGTVRERANYIYDYVINDIDENEEDDYFASSATYTVTRKKGSRLPLLLALYNAAGITANVVLLRYIGSPEDMSIPLDEFLNYYIPAVAVETETGPAYVQTFEDAIPFDYLQPEVQGMDVVTIAPNAPITTSRIDDFSALESDVYMSYNISDDGSAKANGKEHLQSDRALMMRYIVSRSKDDPEQIERQISRSLSRSYGRIELTHFEYEGLDNNNIPFNINYDFDVTSFAAPSDNKLTINSSIFSYQITKSYAPFSARNYPLIINKMTAARRNLTFNAPDGYKFNDVKQADTELHTEFGNFMRHYTVTDSKLVVDETLEIRPQRITPDKYPEFRAFCIAIDKAQSEVLSLTK